MPKHAMRGRALIASVYGTIDAATIHKDTFVAHGLPSTFLDDLETGVAELETSQSDRQRASVLVDEARRTTLATHLWWKKPQKAMSKNATPITVAT